MPTAPAQMVREGIGQGGKPVLKAHSDAAPLLQAIIETMPGRNPYSASKSSSRLIR